MGLSEVLFDKAKNVMPGGVNSPVRAFTAVGASPRFIISADGAVITDADGNRYIDYVGSWGPMILGHNHPLIREAVIQAAERGLSFGAATEAEVTMAELICSLFPTIDMVRMVNSGTEAVMSAIRVARGATGRDKIIKFEGCYHGHCDAMLVSAGSGLMTAGVSASAGVTEGTAKDTLTAPYNDLETTAKMLEVNKDQIAAVIVEPVAANMGVVLPKQGFLKGLRALCDTHGALLIFDEVIGFRLGLGGARNGSSTDLTVRENLGGARRWRLRRQTGADGTGAAGSSIRRVLSGNPSPWPPASPVDVSEKEHPEVYAHLDAGGKALWRYAEADR